MVRLNRMIKHIFDVKKMFYSSDRLGKQGEDRISASLRWANFWGHRGLQLQNIYVPKGNGETTEIDLLYITAKGIFVMESKNYTGYIFGNEQHVYWTQTLYKGKDWLGRKLVEKERFYNPVWQNRNHIKFLRQYLKLDIPFFSVVVFSDHCALKSIEVNSDDVIVCHRADLSSVISHIWNNYRDVLTEGQVEELYQALNPLTQCTQQEKEVHVDQIREKLSHREYCPRCGGKLVLRTARNGPNAGKQFYGCSNYPRCRFTRNI